MVRDHLSSSLLTLDEMDTLRDSARLLKRARITGAPVLDGSSLSGIMSRNDLLRAIDQVPSDTTPEAFETQIGEIQEQNVWQVMADSPITIPPEVSLMAAARKMQEKKLNRLMVKGQYSSMLGIISSTDVVFTMLGTDATAAASVDPSQYEYKAELDAEETEECALGSCVRGHMATDLVCMKADMTLKEVACLLRAARVTGAPVIDENGALLGVVSRNDLLIALTNRISEAVEEAGGDAFATATAEVEAERLETVMSREPITISPGASMLEATKILAREKLNRLMVTNPQTGALCGILSSTDVVFAMLGCDYSLDEEEEEDAGIDERRLGNLYRKGIY